MYYILVTNQNEMYATQVQRIMHRSKLVDDLFFVVEQTYNGHDMALASVVMEYVRPVSRKYETEYLTLASEKYNDTHIQYQLPIDTNLTQEVGEVEIALTFAMTELDASGNGVQRVRKISPMTIKILPVAAWSDIIPDSALSALDQRIIKLDAHMRALSEYTPGESFAGVDNLKFDPEDDSLQLMSKGEPVGSKVSVKDMMESGIPVVDIGRDQPSDDPVVPDGPSDDEEDDIVEF